MARRKKTASQKIWRRIDLHLHTPASNDYLEPGVTYLDILRQAEARQLDMIAFTDHNTVAGIRAMRREIEELELLESLKRLRPDESRQLTEYQRLLSKILVLPGFEFTATFGFHIIGVFAPETPLRTLEHILLNLNIPADKLDEGSSTVGATADVLMAYEMIDNAGGISIAAHANSTNGVAMRGFRFGGQTKIAYTQDPHLHVLEVTDLEQKGRRATQHFFNGSKPEYPRRMHCIQGSDAHRLMRDPNNPKNLGIGDRVTEVLLGEVSFAALREVFLSQDFARTRPFHSSGQALDFVQAAREEGPNIVQSFHEKMTERGGHLYGIIADVCALANTNGGTIYVGVSDQARAQPVGVSAVPKSIEKLQSEISRRITPELSCSLDELTTQGKKIVRISVPRGSDPPYAIDDNKIYVRDESDTSLAVRDEIVQLVFRGRQNGKLPQAELSTPEKPLPDVHIAPPRTGVEIVNTEERDGTRYHTVHDLRNGNKVKNVTRKSARRLWHYAILERENDPDLKEAKITWHNDLGLIKTWRKGGATRHDLCQRTPEGLRVYYGVTEDGVHGAWRNVIGADE